MPRRTIISRDGRKLDLAVDDRAGIYDLSADPYEMTNVLDSPQNRDRALEIAERLRA
jgi:hypothetical protein